jgi:hypothetical protein
LVLRYSPYFSLNLVCSQLGEVWGYTTESVQCRGGSWKAAETRNVEDHERFRGMQPTALKCVSLWGCENHILKFVSVILEKWDLCVYFTHNYAWLEWVPMYCLNFVLNTHCSKIWWNPVKKILKIPRSFFLSGKFLKRVGPVMLIKWENFGAFLSWLLRREIFLTGFFLSKFHCIHYDTFWHEVLKVNAGTLHLVIHQSIFCLPICMFQLKEHFDWFWWNLLWISCPSSFTSQQSVIRTLWMNIKNSANLMDRLKCRTIKNIMQCNLHNKVQVHIVICPLDWL